MAFRWVRERPLYQVLAEYRCDRTFVRTVDKVMYVQRMTTVFRDIVMMEDELSSLRFTKCVKYPSL